MIRPGDEDSIMTSAHNENRFIGGRRTYLWGGCFHFLPENYRLPKVGLHIIWQHWWLGNLLFNKGSTATTDTIPPLRTVTAKDFKVDSKT